ncbi:MAG: aminoacetone oxidase family FAD-binding enzyme [Patescibacteria group bacterium]
MNANHYDVIVIGGGAAGLMAAGTAAARGKHVLLLEKNPEIGKKLSISGGGRCNIANAEEDEKVLLSQYGKAESFLYSAFSEFGMHSTFSFFETLGLPLVVQKQKRAFPRSERAEDVVAAFEKYLKKGRVEVRTDTPVARIKMSGGKIEGIQTQGFVFTADSYILATGGVSHPETGSTGDGFKWLSELGHTVAEPTPTIVPLAASDAWIPKLKGKTLKDVRITFYQEDVRKFSKKGSILLTHFGLSGPTILNAAGSVRELLYGGIVTATIDLFPTTDLGHLDAKLVALFEVNKNKLLRNTLPEILPNGTTEVLLSLVPSIDPEIKVHSVTKEQRRALVELLKGLPVSITGLMGFNRAVVADGGVLLNEVDMRTMRSKKCENLFITGDLLHISRPSGGYSLQLCWTTGYVAGVNA